MKGPENFTSQDMKAAIYDAIMSRRFVEERRRHALLNAAAVIYATADIGVDAAVAAAQRLLKEIQEREVRK